MMRLWVVITRWGACVSSVERGQILVAVVIAIGGRENKREKEREYGHKSYQSAADQKYHWKQGLD